LCTSKTPASHNINFATGGGLTFDDNGIKIQSCTTANAILKWNNDAKTWGCAKDNDTYVEQNTIKIKRFSLGESGSTSYTCAWMAGNYINWMYKAEIDTGLSNIQGVSITDSASFTGTIGQAKAWLYTVSGSVINVYYYSVDGRANCNDYFAPDGIGYVFVFYL
jgi:hypothetical protein